MTRLEKFLELNLRIHKLVEEANIALRIEHLGPMYTLKVNPRMMAEVMQRRKEADKAEMVGDVLYPRASRCVQ